MAPSVFPQSSSTRVSSLHAPPTTSTVLVDVADAAGPASRKNTSDAYTETGRMSVSTCALENPLTSVR